MVIFIFTLNLFIRFFIVCTGGRKCYVKISNHRERGRERERDLWKTDQ